MRKKGRRIVCSPDFDTLSSKIGRNPTVRTLKFHVGKNEKMTRNEDEKSWYSYGFRALC